MDGEKAEWASLGKGVFSGKMRVVIPYYPCLCQRIHRLVPNFLLFWKSNIRVMSRIVGPPPGLREGYRIGGSKISVNKLAKANVAIANQ